MVNEAIRKLEDLIILLHDLARVQENIVFEKRIRKIADSLSEEVKKLNELNNYGM